jgi:hypothetical protein
MTINVPNPEALRAGLRHAQDHLKFWDQNEFLVYWDADGQEFELPEEGEPPCGTTACLAGHILLATGMSWKEISRGDISSQALHALGYQFTGDRDAMAFDELIFMHVYGDTGPLARTQEKFDELKAHVAEVTGVEL